METKILVDLSLQELSDLINNAVSNALKNNTASKIAKGSLTIVNVSELLKKEGFRQYGYAFIKSRLKDGTFECDENNRITVESVNNYINLIKSKI